MEFEIEGEYIELSSLLKIIGVAESGGQAGLIIKDGYVKLNGNVELRKRAKLRKGDIVEIEEDEIIKLI